ncbi:hypothetical protein FCV81_15500 [Vibrio breoganii]|nr:hypothetical protein FCV81_15500 [Vibrio breoganii]
MSQLYFLKFQLSAISYQLSAISYQLSAISYQLSARIKLIVILEFAKQISRILVSTKNQTSAP